MYGIFCAIHILFLYNRFFPIRIRRCIFEHLDRTAVSVCNTGARILIMDNSEKGYHALNEDWSEYYNPLEKIIRKQ